MQDVAVQSKDFEGLIPGMVQLFKCMDSNHGKLVMPESMVIFEAVHAAQRDEQKGKVSNRGTSVDEHACRSAHKDAQEEISYLKDALNTTRIDREQQARLLDEIMAQWSKKQDDNQSHVSLNNPQSHYSNQPPYPPPGPNATQQELLGDHERKPKSEQGSSDKKVVTEQLQQVGTQTQTAHTLVEGSRVQIPCNSPGEPFKYGVIRWIGDVPAILGLVAGIELVSGIFTV